MPCSVARVCQQRWKSQGWVAWFVSGRCFPQHFALFSSRELRPSGLSLVHYSQTQGRGFSPTNSCLAQTSLEKPAAGWRQTFPRLTRWTSDSLSPPALRLVVLQNLPSLLICLPRLSPGPTIAHLP